MVSRSDTPLIVAGPCSIESEQQLRSVAESLCRIGGIDMIRCGVWKPRTHPGGFEGLGEQALQWIEALKSDMPQMRFCCEVAQPNHVECALRHGIDAVWIGARTTGNPFSVGELAQALAGCHIPVLVKNAPSPDVELWIGAIERLMAANIDNIVAVHRGFALYNNDRLRNNPLWEVPIALRQRMPDLPIICDPSHIAGRRELVQQVAAEALAIGFDGLMIECHPDPDNALTDAAQQITPQDLQTILQSLSPRNSLADSAEQLLHGLRLQIDEVDRQLLSLLGHRLDLCREIADIKRANNIAVLQSKRMEQMLQNRMQQAEQQGIDPQFVKDIFEKIHAESVRVQLNDEH